ncbi:DUF5132 domain-containing protein [Streptomyces sp. NPDC059894]|uniref:DUF5132 domain-containing protein n=1 Tax=unclassified Streptomyces TaxID=2593676 RepID=UPI00366942A7
MPRHTRTGEKRGECLSVSLTTNTMYFSTSFFLISARRKGCRAMPPVVPPFLIGLVAASLVKRVGKPLVRGIVKTSVGLGLEVQRAVHEASAEIHGLAAEVSAEMRALHAPQAAATGGPAHAQANAGQTGGRSKPAAKPRSAAKAG